MARNMYMHIIHKYFHFIIISECFFFEATTTFSWKFHLENIILRCYRIIFPLLPSVEYALELNSSTCAPDFLILPSETDRNPSFTEAYFAESRLRTSSPKKTKTSSVIVDQRTVVKIPVQAPCSPAYPQIHGVYVANVSFWTSCKRR